MKKMNFRTKLFVTLLPIVFVCIVTPVVFNYFSIKKGVSTLMGNDMEQIVYKTSIELNMWLGDRERETLLLAEKNIFKNTCKGGDAKITQDYINSLQKRSNLYENIFIADSTGVIFMDSIEGKSVGIELSKAQGFEENANKAFSGESCMSEALLSPISGRPIILLTAPLMDGKRILGIVGTSLELNVFKEEFVTKTKIGKSGYVYVTNSKGTFLAHPEKDMIMKDGINNYSFGADILAKKNGSLEYKWKDGKRISYFITNEKTGWVIASSASTNEFMSLVKGISIFSLILGLLAVAIIAGVLWSVTSKVFKVIMSVTTELNVSSNQLASASAQVSGSSQTLAQASGEQAASLEETSSAIEELASMAKQNAGNSNECCRTMKEVDKSFQDLNEKLENVISKMADIKSNSAQTHKIIKTIDEIAFQTNLLALNAAVEAARAGAAGAGFAVVAGEVRNLSIRAAEAAKNTAELIDRTVSSVGDGDILTDNLKTALTHNMHVSEKVCGLVNEIASASGEQSKGVEQINIAISQMDKTTQSIAANSEESAASSEELNAQASELGQMVTMLVNAVGGIDIEKGNNSHRKGIQNRKVDTLKTGAIKTRNVQALNQVTANSGRKKSADIIPLEDDYEEF